MYFGLIQIILNPTSNGIFSHCSFYCQIFFLSGDCVHHWWSCLCMLTSNPNINRKWVPQGATSLKNQPLLETPNSPNPNQAPQNAYSPWVQKQAQNESNIRAKSNIGAKCVWASSIVFEEKMGQAKSKYKGKKKQLVILYCLSNTYVHI